MNKLNPAQRDAVRYVEGPLLVLAGAGSGKTRVITHKIAHLIRAHGLEPGQITAVTFTNKAAREMRQRVAELCSEEGSHSPRISTFHTLGLRILREDGHLLGLRPGFSIFDETDRSELLRAILREGAHDPEQAGAIGWQIGEWKNHPLAPDQLGPGPEQALAATVYREYQRRLQSCQAVDFDDLIRLPLLLLERHHEIRVKWRGRIRYLLVDEYQDTNRAQYLLVRQLVGDRGCLTVVGDDDQSIYAWRGARPENLRELADDFPGLKVIRLEQNYRSRGNILQAANALIANNPHLFEKRLWSELGPGDPLQVLTAADESDEAALVADRISHEILLHRRRHGDFAILYRGNHQARPFEQALRERDIPYRVSGGTSFFARSEIRDVMAYLRLLANPDDDTAFLRIVNTPRREIGPATLERLTAWAARRQRPLLAAAGELGLRQELSPAAARRLGQLCDWLRELGERARHEPARELVPRLLADLDYRDWLETTSSRPEQAAGRWRNVEELVEWIGRLETRNEGATLGDLVERLALMDLLEQRQEEQGGDRVQLMTLHAAKGLEFPRVFLVGMEENLLPHRSAIEADDVEEERRLAYVGITRARHHLCFTLARRRNRHGAAVECEPSRFLSEIPVELLDWPGRSPERPAEERREQGRNTLALLRARLETG